MADFLRRNADQLDKCQLGELLGHHGEFSLSVMHAWVDGERYAGMSIDAALRRLLEQFRLPGEAQKIDRIMEKFAEASTHDMAGIVAIQKLLDVLYCSSSQYIQCPLV